VSGDRPADFVYDRIAYPTFIIGDLAPDHLSASATLHGWKAPDVATASVFEIGCGDGINLIAAAAVAPQSRFIGFDYSEAAIDRGRALVTAAGLTNVDLHFGDALTYPHDGETYDYILCHGVLAWVPPPVREAVIALIGGRLAPGGIAYLGFDSLPGAAAKATIAGFLLAEVAGIADPAEAMRRSTEVLEMLQRNQRTNSILKDQLDFVLKQMPKHEPAYFFHDWLAEHYAPVDFKQFVNAAAGEGLMLAGSSSNYDLFTDSLDAAGRTHLLRAGDDPGKRLLALDVLHGSRFFRRDLLVRKDAPPARDPDGITALSFDFEGVRDEVEFDGRPAVRFFLNEEKLVVTENEATIALLDCLVRAEGNEVPYARIRAETRLPDREVRAILLGICSLGLIGAHTTAQGWVRHPGERPLAGRLLRLMLATTDRGPSLRANGIRIEQLETRYFLTLCDGTRTRADLVAEMGKTFKREITLEKVEGAIEQFARQRAFEA
jgi:SAM-dependent methyltransferase